MAAVDPALESTSTRGAAGRFRGWWVLGWCTIALGLTAPGQTVGVAVFVDELIAGLGLSRSEISAAYLFGTGCGALALPLIGRWIDRAGVSRAMLVVGLGFGAALMGAGAVQGLVTLALAFAGVRMLGQGALALVGQTGIALWFDRRRGLAIGLATTVSAGMMALAPLALTGLIGGVGWRAAWVVAGAVVWITVVPVALFGIVDRPADVGQIPDGRLAPGESTYRPRPSLSTRQALRTPAFWSLTAVVALSGCLVTGLYFNQFSILAERGLTRTEAATVFLPGFGGTVAAGFLFSWLTDRVSARILLPITGTTLAAGLLLATVATPGPRAALYGLVLGVNIGQMHALSSTVYARWFGTAHIGAIRGIATSITIGGSALGPLLLSLGFDAAGSYTPVLLVSAAVTIAVAAGTVTVPAPASAAGSG